MTWLMISYPEALTFNGSFLQSTHNDFRAGLTKQWESYGGHICADEQLTARVLNLIQHYVEDVASVAKQINLMIEGLKKTTITTVNQDQAYQSRAKRWVLLLLAGIGTALVLVPALKDKFCHLTTSLGFGKETQHLERLLKENHLLNEKLRSLSLATWKELHLIADSLNSTQQQLRQTSLSSNENF